MVTSHFTSWACNVMILYDENQHFPTNDESEGCAKGWNCLMLRIWAARSHLHSRAQFGCLLAPHNMLRSYSPLRSPEFLEDKLMTSLQYVTWPSFTFSAFILSAEMWTERTVWLHIHCLVVEDGARKRLLLSTSATCHMPHATCHRPHWGISLCSYENIITPSSQITRLTCPSLPSMGFKRCVALLDPAYFSLCYKEIN